ncbi:biofilm development regulator YmgB/AriR family protein [Rahnella perminowiae]|uniref:Biofilm development protein AriR n=1 Tax=Rahnella perminowiae TaxID=2816244 RepID=A0ABS6L3A7_9GAMM|nr:biofilm development regulator YmgB/AriR family protein [Rahnella perminowiae]MBU9825166.1 biofilm development protein AriR [Rahnella perminowiae]MBU9836322.1 biofilm development protein AriR [Rahnella perminowiae]UJD92025.1 biofilm development protein AriR [Rahnella aquatilis]
MQDVSYTHVKLADYILAEDPELLVGNETVIRIYNNLKSHKERVTHKDIILCLIQKIEQESDSIKQDVYLEALEYVVYRTPDDDTL